MSAMPCSGGDEYPKSDPKVWEPFLKSVEVAAQDIPWTPLVSFTDFTDKSGFITLPCLHEPIEIPPVEEG